MVFSFVLGEFQFAFWEVVTMTMRISSVTALEAQHRDLDRQIHRLERRGTLLSPPDRDRAVQLKRLKLATKDQLAALKR